MTGTAEQVLGFGLLSVVVSGWVNDGLPYRIPQDHIMDEVTSFMADASLPL